MADLLAEVRRLEILLIVRNIAPVLPQQAVIEGTERYGLGLVQGLGGVGHLIHAVYELKHCVGAVDAGVAYRPDLVGLLGGSEGVVVGLDQDGLVAVVGTAAVHVVRHDVVYQMECVVLTECVVEPLERVVCGHEALEHAGFRVEIVFKGLRAVVARSNELLGTGRDKHERNDADSKIYLFHLCNRIRS